MESSKGTSGRVRPEASEAGPLVMVATRAITASAATV